MRHFIPHIFILCSLIQLSACGNAPFKEGADDTSGGFETIDDSFSEDLPKDVSMTEEIAPNLPDTGPKPFPPLVPGPPPELFDCRASGQEFPERKSPHPISCILDPECTGRLVVGHRSAGGELASVAPENSIEGIKAAILMGVDGVEIDIRHTKDEVLVLMHDSSVDRTTTGQGMVSQMNSDEVIGLPLLLPPKSAVEGDFSCSVVTRLVEAFDLTRDRVFVDLDAKTDRMDLVVKAIEDAGLIDQVFVSVSDYNRALEARALNPAIRVQVRPDNTEELAEMMQHFARPPEIVEIPVGQVKEMEATIHEMGAKVFTDVWGADAIAYVQDDLETYLEIYADGADVQQSELVPLLLQSLDRWPYELN